MYKGFKTLEELRGMAEAHKNACHDSRGVDIRKLQYKGENNVLNFKNGASQEGNLFGKVEAIGESGQLSKGALGQLAERVGAPGLRWLRDEIKCPDELREGILNWKFANWPEAQYLLRQKLIGETNIIRAVLSTDYSVYDNHELIDAVIDAVEETDLNVKVFRPQVGDDLRAYLIFPETDFDMRGFDPETGSPPDEPTGLSDGGGGGGLKPGLYLSNNEIGGGKARITGGLYRSYCSNGMIIGWENTERYAVTHKFKSKAHMHLKVNEGIADAMKMSETAAVAFLDKRAIMVKKSSLAGIADKWADKYGLLLETREEWQKAIRLGAQAQEFMNAAEPINLLTALRNESAAEQENIERCAGDMVMAEVAFRDRAENVQS